MTSTTSNATNPFEAEVIFGETDSYMDHAAETFKQAITIPGLMTLGAHDLKSVPGRHKLGALLFTARILPMTKDGTRGTQARRMAVLLSLTPADEIDVEVRECATRKEHTRICGLYIDQLPRLGLALDYDGDTVLNPRYMLG